ncbi:hypothetical protein BDU57DRAFT_540878 [Ampelomyces quisqualis]|uniref:DUF7962 domain-containing protein n=1 Tax=Ampelomyces quisqualis TaxID=50730 RepID=A0A6A5QHA2_AMPQU|nr:hypothetical protein BDU57DRAFT_540878 [Ampelomyces quisqualis]
MALTDKPILFHFLQSIYSHRILWYELEERYPSRGLTPTTSADIGLQKLFESYPVDGGVFANAVRLMPYWTETGLLKNKAFLNDRQNLSGGRRMTEDLMEAGRPDGVQHIRQVFELFESTFLGDGRDWILGTKEPTVADIDAVWPFKWMIL